MANASKNIALEARGIRASLGNTQVLHGLDLALAAGRWTSVVGPNGAGKSTLLKVLAGLLPHSGEVNLLGQPLASLTGRQGQIDAVQDRLVSQASPYVTGLECYFF